MEKASFSHLFIKVRNLSSFRELLETLGLKLVYQDDKYFRFQGDSEFYVGAEEDKTATQSGSIEINIYAPNIDEVFRKLQNKGYSDITEPKMMPWGANHIYFTDENGIKFSVHS